MKPEPKRQKLALTELGFAVDVAERAQALRGNYDAQRIERDNPQLVKLVAWLLSLPGMTYQAIAEAAGMAWETVAAIAATRRESIREFKLRQAGKLALVLDAAAGGLMAKAARGELSALDFKLLTDAWLQLSGEGQLMRIEDAPEDPQRAAFRRFLEQSGQAPRLPAAGMGREAPEILQSGAPAGGLAGAALALPAAPVNGPGGLAKDSESVVLEARTVEDQRADCAAMQHAGQTGAAPVDPGGAQAQADADARGFETRGGGGARAGAPGPQ